MSDLITSFRPQQRVFDSSRGQCATVIDTTRNGNVIIRHDGTTQTATLNKDDASRHLTPTRFEA